MGGVWDRDVGVRDLGRALRLPGDSDFDLVIFHGGDGGVGGIIWFGSYSLGGRSLEPRPGRSGCLRTLGN